MQDTGIQAALEARVTILSGYRERIEARKEGRKQEVRNGGHHFLYCLVWGGGGAAGTVCVGGELTHSVL
jgi:hypothetical protein